MRIDMLEVEVKLPVKDREAVIKSLENDGFVMGKLLRESDEYFDSDFHDFKKCGDAFRIRRTENLETGEKHDMITYKGPRLSSGIKARKELETGVENSDVMEEVMLSLGYRKVDPVVKTRRYYHKDNMTACVDSVEMLGVFLEIEIVVSEEVGYENAEKQIAAKLKDLGLDISDSIKASYLTMVQAYIEKLKNKN